MTTVLLSVCIITRNRVDHVRSLLQSLSSTLPEFLDFCEVIVLDNASAETLSPKEAELYSSLFTFRLIRHSIDIGFCRNYISALHQAKGEWCWVLGDDDVYDFENILPSFRDVISRANECDVRTQVSLIHINHSQFIEDEEGKTTVIDRVHRIATDTVFSEASFLDAVSSSLGGLLFVSSNIYRMSALRPHIHEEYLVSFASSCVCLAIPLIAIRYGQVYFIARPLIQDRLQGEWSMSSTPEKVFRLELPCSVFASRNPAAIRTLIIRHSRLRTLAKTLVVGVASRDFKKSWYYLSNFVAWSIAGTSSPLPTAKKS
jgi:glycosyltransferase involved in cell wall biosynthesis